ncbi:ABC transporter ATP-binding protein [Georgenia sp. TF02-10]|uniref:dipeptide ABC transporter ATP-binding protein n=1 Tax=Georgenia sp. TF02-10 TaxID=2917725 RepID=UPI001FA74A5B|nr:ABC transporter ATP-binding protein [Georgenia sp. TF02-10]UNX53805.1 ABC transporter ATP-binding protein [Georgenia sp. TF02-10]
MSERLLELDGLRVRFAANGEQREVVRGVSLRLAAGECLAIVGESGSGKSVTARSLVGLTGGTSTVTTDRFALAGADASGYTDKQWQGVRGRQVGLVLQDALVSLDPLRTVGAEIAEAALVHQTVERRDVEDYVRDLLRTVGVPRPDVVARQYPHQLSGGLRQRALIASALAGRPPMLIADEPTTALDVTVQAQILRLLETLKAAGTGLVLISHDLAVVGRLADRISVMHDGVVVETGASEQMLTDPQDDYTKLLLRAIPTGRSRGTRLSPLPPAVFHEGWKPAVPRGGGALLRARGLHKRYRRPDGSWFSAVRNVGLTVEPGSALGVVGESGSGKSTVARMLLGVTAPDAGSVELDGAPWNPLAESRRRPQRRRIQAIYQDPLSSFDPRWTVQRTLVEALEVGGVPGRRRPGEAVALLDQVGLTRDVLARRPLELSGGQRQRIAITRALATRPEVLVCDEPVSALDVSVQAQVLDLLADLRRQLGVALVLISHDLGVVQHVCDRVLVMKDGAVVESGDVEDLFAAPQHPYTRELLAAVPVLEAAGSAAPVG